MALVTPFNWLTDGRQRLTPSEDNSTERRAGAHRAVHLDVIRIERYAGTDAHKDDLYVTVFDVNGEQTDHFHAPNPSSGHEEITDRFDPADRNRTRRYCVAGRRVSPP